MKQETENFICIEGCKIYDNKNNYMIVAFIYMYSEY